jgi:hypothetical protein
MRKREVAVVREEIILEQRLKDFYDRVPDIEDALPFKDYLIKHEDSRMAWYLLGKQYVAKGEEAKARYCFSQAREIYEAFESKALPANPAVPLSKTRQGMRSIGRLLATVLILGVGMTLPGVKAVAPGSPIAADIPQMSADHPNPTLPVKGGTGSSTAQPIARQPAIHQVGVISAATDPKSDGRQALGELLVQKAERMPLVLVKAVSIGHWSDWLKSVSPVASVTSDGNTAVSVVNWYDSAWCGCRPGDPGSIRDTVQSWKPIQEQKLLLVSAVEQYRLKFGKLPASPQALAGDYPSNLMAGWTQPMTEWFTELTKLKKNQNGASSPVQSWPAGTGGGKSVPAGAWLAMTEQPLEIVVDKTNHRLAIVSGHVLVRNYAVGLGGKRTPEGQFAITEKVRNPNGKKEGPYGSRGMTLSDTRYAIHGTNEPNSVGKDESSGCIRLGKDDLEELYDLVPAGTKVTIAKGGLPSDTRVPPERFRLPHTRDETNPHKVYTWLS